MCQDNEHVPPIISKGRVFVKNAINSFFLDVQYKKKLLVTFPPKTLPLEIIGGTGSLSLAQNVVQSRYLKEKPILAAELDAVNLQRD